MYTFIYATDFNEGCENAFSICKELSAKHSNSTLVLAHVISPAQQKKKEQKVIATEKLKQLQHALKQENISANIFLEEGEVVEKLAEVCEQYNAALLVAGACNCGALAQNTIGDTAEQLLQALLVPVLLVPSGVSIKDVFKHITYATDYKTADGKMVEQLITLFAPFHPQVNLLHVYTSDESPELEYAQMEHFQKDITQKVPYNNLSFQIMHGESVAEKLHEHLQLQAAGLLVLATHHGHLVDRLFSESVGREMLFDTPVPLLAFHYRKHFKPILL